MCTSVTADWLNAKKWACRGLCVHSSRVCCKTCQCRLIATRISCSTFTWHADFELHEPDEAQVWRHHNSQAHMVSVPLFRSQPCDPGVSSYAHHATQPTVRQALYYWLHLAEDAVFPKPEKYLPTFAQNPACFSVSGCPLAPSSFDKCMEKWLCFAIMQT